MADKRYRVCHSCGNIWNVSKLEKLDRQYICPKCERQSRKLRQVK